jgi:hypothetical protein
MRALRARRRWEAEHTRLFVQRARLTSEVAAQALSPVEPLLEGSADALACELYRQAIYWALRALALSRSTTFPLQPSTAIQPAQSTAAEPEPPAAIANKVESSPATEVEMSSAGSVPDHPRPGALWDQAAPSSLLRSLEAAGELGAVRRDIERTFVDFAELSREDQAKTAARLARITNALLSEAAATESAFTSIWVRRSLIGASVLSAGLILALVISAVRERNETSHDLAAGKPWRASSVGYGACQSPQQSCPGGEDFFFHTAEELEPWLEIDLGAPKTIRGVRIDNRKDCCAERGRPLVVEISGDQRSWKRVARKDESFRSWLAHFEPATGRWVRIRIDKRRDFLHLSRVRVLSE